MRQNKSPHPGAFLCGGWFYVLLGAESAFLPHCSDLKVSLVGSLKAALSPTAGTIKKTTPLGSLF